MKIVSSKGEKRKLSGQTTGEETKVMEVKRKAPLKADLIVKFKALEKESDELEKENDILKLEKVGNIKTIEKLKKKVAEMEELAIEFFPYLFTSNQKTFGSKKFLGWKNLLQETLTNFNKL